MAMEQIGVEVVFGIPGGAVLPAYDPLLDSEQDPAHPGPARAGRRSRGDRVRPGDRAGSGSAWRRAVPAPPTWSRRYPTRTWTPFPWWRSPVRSSTSLIGTDGFQEADISGITLPITKHNFLVTKPEDIARTIGEAFHLAGTGRPGPVLVDIAKDAMQAMTEFTWPVPFDLPGYHPVTRPHSRQVREAARMITDAKKPGALRRRRRHQGRRGRGAEGAGRAHRRPGGHHADGSRRVPRQPPAAPGHARHARHGRRGRRAAEGRPDRRARRQVRRPGDREAGHLRARRADRARRHRPGGDLQEPARGRADRR